jgi:hypothetical protein
MPEIKYLTLTKILTINKYIEILAKKDEQIKYENRFVRINVRKNLNYLVNCAMEYYSKTEDIILTATYYLILLCHVKMINRHCEIDLAWISNQILEIHKSLSCDYILCLM